jgi:serine/threonine-protein kinase RsbW
MPINLKAKKEILLAISEAITNGLVHGNKKNPAKAVELVFLQNDGYLEIRIDDQGKGFKPQDVDLKKRADGLAEDGRGIPIMKACMDEVKFRFIKGRGMRVVLRKKLA